MSDTKKWPMLYVKTSAGSINYWQVWTEDSFVCMKWGKLGGQELTSKTPATSKNENKANATSPDEQAIKEAESRFKKQLRVKYVHSIEEANTEINIKPMLAYELDEKRIAKLVYPLTGQPKLDGCRCLAYLKDDGTVRLMSRGGLDYDIEHIVQELSGKLEPGLCLDGEIYCHGMNLQTIRHHIETPSDDSKQLNFVCYDMTSLPANQETWEQRQVNLSNWFKANFEKLRYTKELSSNTINDFEELDSMHDTLVENGYEGLILRLNDGVYKLASRSRSLLKYKKFQDSEFLVKSWSLGKDGIVQYTCLQEDGLEFDARPVGSLEERTRLLEEAKAGKAIGQLLTVRFKNRSKDNIPLMPLGIAFRSKKDMDNDGEENETE